MKKFKRVLSALAAMLAALSLAACSGADYAQISMDEAAQVMEQETDFILLDVRTPEEYAGGHIPGAINVPNETIGSDPVDALPDKEQKILVYCRSGNRSKMAAAKLAEQGYTNIVEIGGINSWSGAVVTD